MDKNLLDSKKEYKIFFFGLIQIGVARAEARSYVLTYSKEKVTYASKYPPFAQRRLRSFKRFSR